MSPLSPLSLLSSKYLSIIVSQLVPAISDCSRMTPPPPPPPHLLSDFPQFSQHGNWGLNFNLDLSGNRNQFGSESLVIYCSINRFTPSWPGLPTQPSSHYCPRKVWQGRGLLHLSSHQVDVVTFLVLRSDAMTERRKYFECLRWGEEWWLNLIYKVRSGVQNDCECEEWWNDDVKDKNV